MTGIWIRLQHHVFDAVETLALGLIAGLLVSTAVLVIEQDRWTPRIRSIWRIFGFVLYAALTGVIMNRLLGYEVDRTALSRFGGRFHDLLFVLGTLGLGFSIPTAFLVGWWACRHVVLRVLTLLVGVAVLIGQHFFLRDDYAGAHGALVWSSASLISMPLGHDLQKLALAMGRRAQTVAMGVGLGLALFGLFAPPNATVRAEMFREPGSIAPWTFAATIWSVPGNTKATLPQAVVTSRYFHPREGLPPIRPTVPSLFDGQPPVVVLVTIDATRADAIAREKNDEVFPTIARLKREGAYFTQTTSAGSQTAVALSALFSGRYFSQLEWHAHGDGSLRFTYPAQDHTVRFPELLAARGIPTVTFCSITFLSNEYGVIRGFTEEKIVTKGREHAEAKDVIEPLLERLKHVGNEPLFAYVHLTEPHSPYDRGGKQGSAKQRYLREIGVADESLGKLVNLLETRFSGRGILIFSSDHGEAFGEHGTTKHTKTLYEELLRVPLLVYGPRVQARHVDQQVSILDLGPTILDIFGADTPATFMGQSLVPLLAGRDVRLDRPILAEGRLRRALYLGDLKVIDDPRRKVVEVFDLAQDPRELRNIFDTDRARSLPALAALRQFFEVHRVRLDGYETPYKP